MPSTAARTTQAYHHGVILKEPQATEGSQEILRFAQDDIGVNPDQNLLLAPVDSIEKFALLKKNPQNELIDRNTPHLNPPPQGGRTSVRKKPSPLAGEGLDGGLVVSSKRKRGQRTWTPAQRHEAAMRARKTKPWKHSTGPRTDQGKRHSSLNAYKHGGSTNSSKKLRWTLREYSRFLNTVKRWVRARRWARSHGMPAPEFTFTMCPFEQRFSSRAQPAIKAVCFPEQDKIRSQKMSKPKVLISDKMNKLAEDIFKAKGVEVDVKTGLKPEELKAIIGQYDGLAIRSSTTVTPEIIDAAANLKVVGRAGIGVDNVDIKAATGKGVIVMNTPFGNSITTAEHAIAMMFALARDIPQASESTHLGKWEKNKFMGVELYNKTLGLIGCGNIGSIVADRALGLKMNVLAYDPFLTDERAVELGVKKVELDELFTNADFITLHVPKNDKTKGIINKDSIAKMKKGVRIINCARGGLIIEADLKDALDSGQVAGAALDVFDTEPATKDTTPLLGHAKLICTPHLGASTDEAQVNVAIQVAEQMADFLISGAITNALNMPSISAEDAPRLKYYMKLAEQLGSFAGQITENAIKKIDISFEGTVTELNVKPLVQVIVASLLKPQMDTVNMVNAMAIAESRGIKVTESRAATSKEHRSLIALTVETDQRTRTVSGTLFTGREPRIVNIEGVPIEAALAKDMLFIRNEDKPGLIGSLGTILGNAKQNIADFRLGRVDGADSAVCLVSLDAPLNDALFKEVSNLPQVKTAKRLSF